MRRRRVLEAGLLLAGGYAVIVGGLYLLQDGMIFPRAPAPRRILPPEAERWSLAVDDGLRIEGIHLPGSPDAPMILGFPGNAWNAEDFALFLKDCLPDAAITAFHYRGYAPSEGRPSEAALASDAQVIVDAMATRWPGRRLVLVGISLGSGVAAHVVTAPNVDGAVLVVPFDSLTNVAAARYPWVPVRALLRHRFDTAAKLQDVRRPIALISAGEDRLIRPARTDALADVVPNLVFQHRFPAAGHNSVFDEPAFPAVLQDAVAAIAAGDEAVRRTEGGDTRAER